MNRLLDDRSDNRSFLSTALGTVLTFALCQTAHAGQYTPYPLVADAGSVSEQHLLVKNSGSSMRGDLRHADPGKFWIYGLPVVPGARCRLTLTLDSDPASGPPTISIVGLDNKPLPMRSETDPTGGFVALWTVPDRWPYGGRISVTVSAKPVGVSLKSLQFAQTLPDNNGDGLPDAIGQLLTQGMPPNTRLSVARPPAQPCTIALCSQPLTPALDLQTDAIFTEAPTLRDVSAWKDRGYSVWQTRPASFDRDKDKDTLTKLKDEVQTGRDGMPIPTGDRVALFGSPALLATDKTLFDTTTGLTGYCFREPEYAASAGYEPAFKAAWDAQYHTPWQDPQSGTDARYRASTLMADSEANRVRALLETIQQSQPGSRRMVALHSPLFLAQSNLISPVTRMATSNEVTDVLGEVTSDTASLPTRYAGLRQDLTFARAYLEYSSILHAARGTNRRVWFLSDPQIDPKTDPTHPLTPESRSRYEQTLVAALLFPDVNSYQLILPPDRLTSGLPPEDAARIHNILTAFEEMHSQPGATGNAEQAADIGLLVSDSLQWQRGGPGASDLDGLYGLALPLLERGIPVQVLAADRATDPGYLNGFKTLLLSYDYQKPLSARTQIALADWVRRGGSLIYVGGSDPFNAVTDSWWRLASLPAPQMDLWKQLGLTVGAPTTQSAPQENPANYRTVLKASSNEHLFGNRRVYPIDLTPFVRETGTVAVRFSALAPKEQGGAYLASGELVVGGKVAASFVTGSEIENRFLMYDNGSQFDGKNRFAEGDASWTYQFGNLPRNVPVVLNLELANGFTVSAASARPDYGHTLLSTGANGRLSQLFPRLRIGAAYPATLYPLPLPGAANPGAQRDGDSHLIPVSLKPETKPEKSDRADPAGARPRGAGDNRKPADSTGISVLYTLRAGGAPVWMQNVGRGLVMNIGVAPGFFSSSERSAGLLRALTRLAHQRAGGNYSEPGSLRLRRGKYIIVRTFAEPYTAGGRTIDLLAPQLPVADDRVIGPNSVALLYELGDIETPPHVGFVSGRLMAKADTPTACAFFVRGPAGTTGSARLHRGDHRLAGARATDWLGHPVPLQTQEDGGSILVRYANDPDGVLIRVGWQ